MGRVLSVNISEKKGTIKTAISEGNFLESYGLINDAHSGSWHRQVSLLAIESINKMKQISLSSNNSTFGLFAENLTTEGIVLYELPIGTKLTIGETIMEVTQIGKECHQGCEIKNLIGSCIMPHEGIFAKVIKGGYIKPGDNIKII
ncbi:MOSC domain-containing protein YiiM [Clostridium punense]|uniref:MOSC domain-containing protein YiiM n=1 Tax=Clostridium punense TaxID=1054297 RepID=A0ABS4JZ52_9CLOT|nr:MULTISPECIES: MOSC domain-containing protein [Clostridium]EQB90112.1 hypothetical protein M918_01870 [Clostridium sp. BL8]MBP2020818.1 MOSC domain-containing protein YiiM [Clostridium punense]